MIFGFALAVCFNPYIWSAATTPRWSFLAIALPVLIGVSSPNHFTVLHLIGALFLTWTAITLTWTASPLDGYGSLIQLVILASAFIYGGRLVSIKPILAGLALGITVSSLIVLSQSIQALIPHPIVAIEGQGLFGNRNMLAEAAVLVLVGCVGYKLWWYIPGLIPAIVISPMSRGALIGGLAALCPWLWSRSKPAFIAFAVLVCAAAGYSITDPARLSAISERAQVWYDTAKGISIVGHGLGSYYMLFPFLTHSWDIALVRPEHAHNILLELIFEVGVIGAAIYALMVATAYRMASTVHRCIMAAFYTIGLVSFPDHIPTTACLAAIVIGHSSRVGYSLRLHLARIRISLRAWRIFLDTTHRTNWAA